MNWFLQLKKILDAFFKHFQQTLENEFKVFTSTIKDEVRDIISAEFSAYDQWSPVTHFLEDKGISPEDALQKLKKIYGDEI